MHTKITAAMVTLLMLASMFVVGASPAAAEGGPYHWNYTSRGVAPCPNGVAVMLGGGSGWKLHMRRAIDRWNRDVAPGYPGRPYITSITDRPFDGQVIYERCRIDVDEVYDLGDACGIAGLSRYGAEGGYHIYGGIIQMETKCYFGMNDFQRDYAAFHELSHNFGLEHNGRSSSVMSAWYRCICHDGGDYFTLKNLYNGHGH